MIPESNAPSERELEPRLDLDFSDLDDPLLEWKADVIWTTLCRVFESPSFDLSGDDVWDVWKRWLTVDDLDDEHRERIRLFECALYRQAHPDGGPYRPADWSFANLTAVEYSFVEAVLNSLDG